MSLWGWLRGQFLTLPYPDQDCTDRTVIVTGANSGLGLEAARHFVRLGAAKVILACRSIDKGDAARADIEAATQRHGVVEVWQLDLGSTDSVKEFAARAASLQRLDVLLNNASIFTTQWEMLEGHESMVMVNVISTLLLSVLLLPTLRRTATRFNVTPHIVNVSSDAAFLTFFPEKEADDVLERLKANNNLSERYSTTKLLQLMMTQRLAEAVDASGKGHVVVNALDPGLCRTRLFRCLTFPASWALWLIQAVLGRNAEMGSRTLMAAAFAGDDTHGRWMTDCRLHVWPRAMTGEDGQRLTDKIWRELGKVLESVEPGVMDKI